MKTYTRFLFIVFWVVILTGSKVIFAQERTPFTNHTGVELEAKFDETTGTATRIYGIREGVDLYGISRAQLDSTSVSQVGVNVISAYSKQLGISPKDVKVRKIETDGSWWFANYKQVVQGIPVKHSEISFTIDSEGTIVALGAYAFPKIKDIHSPQLSRNSAVRVAQQEFNAKKSEVVYEPELKILPIIEHSDYSWSLIWEIRLFSRQPVKDITYHVDARTGSILREEDNMRHDTIHGTITGTYWPESANVNPTTNGFFSRIRVFNTAGQTVANVLSNYSGTYSTGNLSSGWYTVEVQLANSWIQIRDNASSGNPITHEMSGNLGQYNHQWSTSDGTNVHWHATAMHDFFKGSPFNYSGMDYQMRGYINDGSGTNGAANGTNIFFGSQAGQPWARSRDVVTHEYTHNVIYSIYGGWIGINPNTQGAAMDEGISDYFAAVTKPTPNPDIGADVGVNRTLNNNFTWNQAQGAHWNGQVIGGALWRTRQAIGNATVANNLAFKALQITPHARDFEDYLYNVYLADISQYNGNNLSDIESSFDHHDIETDMPIQAPQNFTLNNPTAYGSFPQFSWNAVSHPHFDHYRIRRMPSLTGVWETAGTTSSTNFTDTEMMILQPQTGGDAYTYVVQAVTDQNVFASSNGVGLYADEFAPLLAGKQSSSEEPGENKSFDFELIGNYPNPFNPATTLSYTLPVQSHVTIDVYNIMGQRVARLVNTTQAAGGHEVVFDAGNLSSGVYIARMIVSGSDDRFFSNEVTMNLVK